MKAFWPYVALAVFAYFTSLLVSLPAQNIYQSFEQQFYPARLTGIEGSIWSGSATSLGTSKFTLKNIRWELSVWDLLFGDIRLSWKINDGLGRASGILYISGEGYQLDSLNADIDIRMLNPLLTQLPVSVAGSLVTEDVSLQLSKGKFSSAQGRIHYSQAAVSKPYFIPLGDFSAELDVQQGALHAKLRDSDAAIFLQGNVDVQADHSYVYQAKISIRDATVSGLVEGLAALGPIDDSGAVQLEGRGRW